MQNKKKYSNFNRFIQGVFMAKVSLKMMTLKVIQCFSQSIDTLERLANSIHISTWKSKGLSDERIKLPARTDNSLAS